MFKHTTTPKQQTLTVLTGEVTLLPGDGAVSRSLSLFCSSEGCDIVLLSVTRHSSDKVTPLCCHSTRNAICASEQTVHDPQREGGGESSAVGFSRQHCECVISSVPHCHWELTRHFPFDSYKSSVQSPRFNQNNPRCVITLSSP